MVRALEGRQNLHVSLFPSPFCARMRPRFPEPSLHNVVACNFGGFAIAPLDPRSRGRRFEFSPCQSRRNVRGKRLRQDFIIPGRCLVGVHTRLAVENGCHKRFILVRNDAMVSNTFNIVCKEKYTKQTQMGSGEVGQTSPNKRTNDK